MGTRSLFTVAHLTSRRGIEQLVQQRFCIAGSMIAFIGVLLLRINEHVAKASVQPRLVEGLNIAH